MTPPATPHGGVMCDRTPAARGGRRPPGRVTSVVDRAWGNYADLAQHAPSPAARAFWAEKAQERVGVLRQSF